MSSVITLGKVKLIYKGNYSSSTSYSAGDIVNLVSEDGTATTKLFIYKNSEPKTGSYPYLKVITGTVGSLGISTNTVTVTLNDNPGGNFNYYVVPNTSYFYSKYFTGDTKVTAKTFVSSTQVSLTLSNYSLNTSIISNDIVTIGTRRVGNRYDRAFNTVDWDVYSESSRIRGSFSTTTNYDVGDIVVKNNQSYVCIVPVGYGTGTVGPSSITPTVDPEYDYLGCWDNYLTGSALNHQRAIGFPNRNPFNWKGHPFITSPTWGNTGIGSCYQGGIPWRLQSNFKDNPNAWRWSMGTHAKDESFTTLLVIDGEGRSLHVGGGYGASENYGSNAGGASYPFGLASEGDSFANNSYWTNDSPAYGNQTFDLNSLNRPRNVPRILQYIKTYENRLYLLSNGTVAVSGRMAALSSHGQSNDYNTNTALEIPRSSFKNRSIVKISCSDNAPANDAYSWAMALDEYGEVWMWGQNGTGQLGFANEQVNPKETYEGLTLGSLGGHEYDATGGGNRKLYAPEPLPCQAAFAGARIVDIWCGLYSAYALDEFGYLWSWGYNNYGQLGYPTNSGFRSTDRSQAPRRITSPLGYTWTGAALGGSITYTSAILTQNIVGDSYTKTGGTNASWDSQVYNSVGYTGSVAVSAKTNTTSTLTMFGLNSDPATDTSYSSIDFCWYFWGGGPNLIQIYENGSFAGPAQQYPYTTNTILSIVYDANEGYVNYYYDYDGDGKYVQLMRRVLKTSVGSNSFTTPLYFDSSFYNTNSNLNTIRVTGSGITQNTWNTFGGIQKFGTTHTSTSAPSDTIGVLDGQGNMWMCGYNGNGECGDATSTTDDNSSSLRRRKFGASGISGSINNFWLLNYGSYFSVLSSVSTHNNIWATGYNSDYRLTTGNTTNQTTPVQIKGPMSRTDNGISFAALQDIVTIVTGGSLENTNQSTVILALDINGYVYASGYDPDGASGAIADGSDSQYVSNNVSKMQQFNSNQYGWVRVYMPNTQQGNCIDIFSTGNYTDYNGSSYTNFSHSAFLMKDGALLTCGSNTYGNRAYGYFPNQGQSMRAPVSNISLPGG
jgi:alpha-tubulin suppressor-like RCC1 family protein